MAGTSEATETQHSAKVVWQGTKEDLRAHEVTMAGQTVASTGMDSKHREGAADSQARRADPEEMFVAALSSCHMLWFVSLARAERIRVTSYEDEAEGAMDGTRFTRVVLRPRVEFEGDVERDVVDRLHHDAHERCFIANSVNCPVEVEGAGS
jgi:organic hydroperoxide reductase OsmC/OhrA